MTDFVQLWVYLSSTPLFGLTATLVVYVLAQAAYQRLAQALNVTWNVAGSGNWDTTTANWTGDNTLYTEGDNATFNNSAGGHTTLCTAETTSATTLRCSSVADTET